MPDPSQDREMLTRRQRVHILCKVEIGNAVEKVDLPFIVGVLADLSGQKPKSKELAEREFTAVDAKGFDTFLADQAPQLAFSVPNRMGNPDQKMAVELNFRQMDDFSPEKVARQIEPLAKLLEMRESLKEIRDRAKSKAKLAGLLDEVLRNSEKREAMVKELGIEPPAAPPGQS